MTNNENARRERYLRSLRRAHEVALWKIDGVSERELRRPMTPTGTNLLGLLKHLASVEAEYLGFVVGRPFPDPPAWLQGEQNDSDLALTAEETPELVIEFARRVFAHGEQTVTDLPLSTPGAVPWWGPDAGDIDLERVVLHLLLEYNRHLGHMDILRENIDGAAGLAGTVSNLPDRDAPSWATYVAGLEAIADAAPDRVVRLG